MRRFGYNFSSLQILGKILQMLFFLYREKRLNRFGYGLSEDHHEICTKKEI